MEKKEATRRLITVKTYSLLLLLGPRLLKKLGPRPQDSKEENKAWKAFGNQPSKTQTVP